MDGGQEGGRGGRGGRRGERSGRREHGETAFKVMEAQILLNIINGSSYSLKLRPQIT